MALISSASIKPDGHRQVKTFLCLCHVREDRQEVIPELSRALGAAGFCVVEEYVAPRSHAGGEDFPALREAVDGALIYCCHVALVITRAFLARPWGTGNLDGWIPYFESSERVLFIWHGVSTEDVAKCSIALARAAHVSTHDNVKKATDKLAALVVGDDYSESRRLALAGVNPRLAAIVGCQTCDGHPQMYFDFVATPPGGATGLFVCPCCLQAYAVRDGVAQLRQESAIVPRYPEHSRCETHLKSSQ